MKIEGEAERQIRRRRKEAQALFSLGEKVLYEFFLTITRLTVHDAKHSTQIS